VHGIGPGTFEFYWLQHGRPYEFVRNAHSLFMETLAELGVVGLALLVAALLTLLATGIRAAVRGDPRHRVVAAAAVAGILAFCVGAGVNWTWQIGVVPMTMLLLGAIAVRSGDAAPLVRLASRRRLPRPSAAGRATLAVLAVAALAAIAIPLSSTEAVRGSQADASQPDLTAALAKADEAARLQPYAATPLLQRALVLEVGHAYAPALTAVRQAISREPRNWRLWLVRSRLEAETGHAQASVAAYRRARALNPGSPVFAR
jgi:O-antigen ligase